MLSWLSTCIAAARAYGIEVLDGVYNSIGDEAGFRAECEQGRLLGMDGKTLVHPRQIAPCNEVFSPAAEEIAWARKIIDAFALPENAGKGVIMVEGRMAEIMHADMARRTVGIAEAIDAMGSGG
jgi:citrate lyase subunit beta/citryl-CoA lyase